MDLKLASPICCAETSGFSAAVLACSSSGIGGIADRLRCLGVSAGIGNGSFNRLLFGCSRILARKPESLLCPTTEDVIMHRELRQLRMGIEHRSTAMPLVWRRCNVLTTNSVRNP